MKISKTLAICLPLLAVMACQGKKSKKNPTGPTADLTGQIVAPGPVAVSPGTPGSANQPADVNQNNPVKLAPGKATGHECETITIDFEKKPDGSSLQKGEKIKDQYQAYGVEFISHKRLPNGDMVLNLLPILFDTAERPSEQQRADYYNIDCRYGNCFGFDSDLSTEKNGKALIIAEHTFDIDTKDDRDLATYPDDNAPGGVLKMVFSKPTSLVSMDLIDIEGEGSNIELFTKSDSGEYVKKSDQAIPVKADGELQLLSVDDHSYVNKLMINLSGSGAVDNIKVCVKN